MIERTIYESQFIKLFFEKLDLQTDYCILRGYEKIDEKLKKLGAKIHVEK